MAKAKMDYQITWVIDYMDNSDGIPRTVDIREHLMDAGYTKSQSNDIIRAARKRSGRYYGKK